MQRGIGDLSNTTSYNGGNEPWNTPWIYNPYAPSGERFSQPGARTKIARLYHAVAQLTSRGDILAVRAGHAARVEYLHGRRRSVTKSTPAKAVHTSTHGTLGGAKMCCPPGGARSRTTTRHHCPQTGTSNAAFWESGESREFDRTARGVNEYRQEVYHPPYVFRPGRPAHAAPAPPAWVAYGGSFDLGFKFEGGAPGGALLGKRDCVLGRQAQELAPDSLSLHRHGWTLAAQ